MMLVGCLALPLYAAAVEKLPFVGDRGDAGGEVTLMHVTVLSLIARCIRTRPFLAVADLGRLRDDLLGDLHRPFYVVLY